ncbi:MAG TPA: VCBS repeat-containing protein [Candidatus Thermoplasmatota archaeon]
MVGPGWGVPRAHAPASRSGRAAASLAAVIVAQTLLPVLALLALSPAASASEITTDEAGRTSFDLPVDGVPQRFNVSVPAGAVVTSFRVGLATASLGSPPDVPGAVALDLGGDGTDWAYGGAGQGDVGWQRTFASGNRAASCSVGRDPCSVPFLLPRDARVESFSFDLSPRANMTLWQAPDYVSVVAGAAAIPLNLSGNSAVTIADLDRDGVLDLVGTGSLGSIRVFSRLGTTGWVFNETLGAVDPTLRQGRVFGHPQVADMTGDGAPDIVVGTAGGNVTLLVRQNATAGPPFEFMEDTSFFAGVRVAGNATPSLGDLDGDGDLDLVVGSSTGEMFHYRHEAGAPTGLRWQVLNTLAASNLSVAAEASPALVDLDGDGDLDLAVGDASGPIVLRENRGNRTAPRFEPLGPASGARADGRSAPDAFDLDGDGTPDLVYGSRGGLVYSSLALGGLPANVTVALSGVGAPVAVLPGRMETSARVVLGGPERTQFSGAALTVQLDAWGNALEEAELSFGSSRFGDLVVSNLSIHYGATFVLPDLAADYRAFAAAAVPQGNRIVAPVAVTGSLAQGAAGARVTVTSIRVVVDDQPLFVQAPFLSLDEDTASPYLLDLRSIVTDEDASTVTFEVASHTNETFARVSVTDGAYLGVDVATGDLSDNWTGAVDVIVRATDRLGQGALSPPIRVVVRPIDDAPVIENIPVQYLAPNESLRLTVRAIDGDPGDHIRFTALPPTPATAAIDAETGFLYWNPTSAERSRGTAHFFVYASDGTLGDVQAFQVVMLPASEPVFGRPLPVVDLLPGRPEFINLFDFATGDVDEVLSVTLDGPPHPYVNLSADGRWLAFDYPADYAPGSDRVQVLVDTLRGRETAAVDLEVLPRPQGLYLAPFSPTPIGRGVTHRVELLRYTYQVVDFPNLSYSVDNPLASVSGFNLTLLAPAEYPGQSLSVTVTVRAGDDTSSVRWRVNLQPAAELPRLSRLPMISAGVRTVDLSWALAQRGVGPGAWPLTTDSDRLIAGTNEFMTSFPDWPLAVAARDFWPIDRARVLTASGEPVLEVETGFDGRSRFVDRLQYFAEDEWAVVDATFASRADLAGGMVHNVSIIGTGPFLAAPLGPIDRLGGGQGTGWRVTFTRDTHIQQLSIVGIAESGGADSTVSWPIWAVVTPRDDPPVYRGGASSVVVEAGHTATVDLAELFEDEEGDDLLFQLSHGGAGVYLDRSTGWLRVDGTEGLNLTGVRVVASEARNQSLLAESDPFSIGLQVAEQPPPSPRPTSPLAWLSDPVTLVAVLLAGLTSSAGLAVYFWTRRRGAPAGGGDPAWEAVAAERPPPTEPPIPGDPAMLALEEEWARVIASRHTDGATPAEETEADLEAGVRSRARAAAEASAPVEEPAKRVPMTSSDTETERRAGDMETEGPGARRRPRPRPR